MKKLFALFITVLLSACSWFGTKTEDANVWKTEKNENCANFNAVKVFQTLNDGALASVCDSGGTKHCLGMTVFVTKTWDLELWDEKVITPPKDKCFAYNGTYKYESKGAGTKTVPVLGFGYKYSPKSEDEAIERTSELVVSAYLECKDHFENGDKSVRAEGLKFCDCTKQAILDGVTEISKYDEEQLNDPSISENLMKKKMEQCAKKYPKAAKAL